MVKEFTVSTFLHASPQTVYDAWLDSAAHGQMIGSSAEVSDQPGGVFTAWDGYISGKNLELESGKRILQAWRTVEFADSEADSHIEVTFEAENDGTRLTLRHWDLPAHGAQYESGWEESYFAPMRAYFG